MIRIGEFAKLCDTTVKTLRYYAEIGLLEPKTVDNYSNYRYYEIEQLKEYYKISHLKSLGFTLEEIKNLDNKTMTKKATEYQKEIENIKDKIKMLDIYANNNIIVKKEPEQKYLSIRKIFETKKDIKQYDDIVGLINHSMNNNDNNLDLELLFSPKNKNLDQTNKERRISSEGLVASIVVDNKEINKAYDDLIIYINLNEYAIIGSFKEIYLSNNTVEVTIPITERKPIMQTEKQFVNDERVIGKWQSIDLVYSEEQFNPENIKNDEDLPYKEIYFLPEGKEYWVISWTKDFVRVRNSEIDVYNPYNIKNINGEDYMFINFSKTFEAGTVLVLKQLDHKEYTKEETKKTDDMTYEFINDENALGLYKAVDFVTTIDQFSPDEKTYKPELFLNSLELLESGECLLEANDFKAELKWTKDYIYNTNSKTKSKYIIKIIDGTKYLFMEWKSGDYVYGNLEPKYYVLRHYIK